jgi:hypothetical protein
MKSRNRYLALTGIIILLMMNCTKPYTPATITKALNYLVVEGVINTGANDTTIIKLSRTVPLTDGAGTNPEPGATITIQSDNSQSYTLNEVGNGMYMSNNLTLDNAHKYRLNINTTDGKNYASDYLTPVTTPPIDSIGFTIKSNGVQLYANTHDPNNNTHYYRWDYVETWQFHAKYFSYYVTNGSAIVQRDPSQFIYQCWTSGISNDIILGSSAKLTQDVIYQNPITFVESTSEKIESRYSILVKQYALTSAGYNYFEQLRKNTEELGGIFDPQPTQLTGNVHCTTDPNLPAIGYVTAGTVQQKRIYINNSQLPNSWLTTYPYDCEQDTALYSNPKTHMNDVERLLEPTNTAFIPTNAYFGLPAGQFPVGYLYTDRVCADCSLRGSLTPPNFWTNQ